MSSIEDLSSSDPFSSLGRAAQSDLISLPNLRPIPRPTLGRPPSPQALRPSTNPSSELLQTCERLFHLLVGSVSMYLYPGATLGGVIVEAIILIYPGIDLSEQQSKGITNAEAVRTAFLSAGVLGAMLVFPASAPFTAGCLGSFALKYGMIPLMNSHTSEN